MLYMILMIISHCIFLANDLLVDIYIYLDYRSDVKQKANSNNFLFEFKMGCKAVETTCHINNVFDPETANESTV